MRYDYRVLPAEDLLSYLQAQTVLEASTGAGGNQGSYVSEDMLSAAYGRAVEDGFRWVSCEHGFAIFERAAEAASVAVDCCEGCGLPDPPIYYCLCGAMRCRDCVEPGPEKDTFVCPKCTEFAGPDH